MKFFLDTDCPDEAYVKIYDEDQNGVLENISNAALSIATLMYLCTIEIEELKDTNIRNQFKEISIELFDKMVKEYFQESRLNEEIILLRTKMEELGKSKEEIANAIEILKMYGGLDNATEMQKS